MKKIFTFALALLLSVSFAFAQSVNEGQVTILKTHVNGFTINVPKVDAKTANAAITEYLADKGLVKPKTEDKYNSYRAQKFSYIGDGTYDIFVKAVQKGKKQDVSTDIIFICSLGNMNVVSSSNNATAASNIKNIVSKFPRAIEKYQLKQRIEEIKKEIENANKEKEKTDKEIQKLQEQITKATEKQDALNRQLEQANTMLRNFTID